MPSHTADEDSKIFSVLHNAYLIAYHAQVSTEDYNRIVLFSTNTCAPNWAKSVIVNAPLLTITYILGCTCNFDWSVTK